MKLGFSIAEICWLEQIIATENIQIQHALNNNQYFINTESLQSKCDGYCKETNTIYEFHGDFWHGNPNLFKSDDINQVNKKTFGELYNKTILREQKIKDLGYNLVVIWECDFNLILDKKIYKEVLIKIKQTTKQKIIIKSPNYGLEIYWNNYLDELKIYIDLNNEIPNRQIFLGRWYIWNKQHYKHKQMSKERILKWTEFILKYPNLTKYLYTFDENYNQVLIFIQQNNKIPFQKSEDNNEKRLGVYIVRQKVKYYSNTLKEKKREKWDNLINIYPDLFKTADEILNDNYNKLTNYIKDFNKLPSQRNENIQIKSLGYWKDDQKSMYFSGKMKEYSKTRYNMWLKLVDTYPKLFRRVEDIWYENYDKLEEFLKQYNKVPILDTELSEKSLRYWLDDQRYNYKHQLIPVDKQLDYEKLVNKYPFLYVKTPEDLWNNQYHLLKKFIEDNTRLPKQSASKQSLERTCALWLTKQRSNLKNNKLLENQINLWKELNI